MDAVKYLKEKKRMCMSMRGCNDCPLHDINEIDDADCFDSGHEKKAVAIVETWSAEHPIKTRQSELLKMFPNAKTNKDGISICPRVVDTKHECEGKVCEECIKEYWLAEVE